MKYLLTLLTTMEPKREWILLGAGIVVVSTLLLLIMILWRGGWALDRQEQQIWYLGVIAIICACLIGVIIIAQARINVAGKGPGGISFEVDGDGAKPGTSVMATETTTKTLEATVAPKSEQAT